MGKDTTGSGETFGRYRIRGVLEEGGMGRLYVAERTGAEGFRKVVALKRILPHLAQDAKLREMFITEARVAARLDHPDIITTFELGEVDGNYFMSMEYLPGEDLAKILSKCSATQPMPIEIAATLAQRVAEGLHYAHELLDDDGHPANLVHRDVNPCNIVVTYYGAVKLLDFGVVKESAAASTTFSGVFRGNYAYCAPEQIESAPVDRRTDIFCLGIVLWECITGQRLFGGGTDVSNIDAVRSKRIEAPSAFRPEASVALDAIVMRCLSRDPARRYQSAADLSAALRQFLATRPHAPNEQAIGGWLEQQFGKERATRKKAIGQGTDIESALAYLKLGTGTSGLAPANADPDAAAAGAQSKPRVLWSTTIRRTPGPSRALSDAAAPSTPAPTSASQIPGAPNARTSSGLGFTARAELPPEVVTTVEVIDPMAAAPGDVAAPRGGEPGTESAPARRTSSQMGMTPGVTTPRRSSGITTPRTSSGMTSAAAPAPAQPARTRSLSFATLTLAIGSVVIGGAVVLGRLAAPTSESAAVAPALGSVEVRSEPPGALIFIDGSPSGLVTPATLSALPLARPLRIQLSKDGYRPAALTVTPESSPTRPQVVKLVQTSAILRLTDLPRRASVFLDGIQLDTGGIVETTVGRHELRVEVKSKIVFSKVLDLQAGEQITKVGGVEGKP